MIHKAHLMACICDNAYETLCMAKRIAECNRDKEIGETDLISLIDLALSDVAYAIDCSMDAGERELNK
jgi:hypothetical protein